MWSTTSPYLYAVKVTASTGGRTVGTYDLHTGVRSIKVARGRLYLNGEPMNIRGVGVHEDNRAQGFAVDDAFRDRLIAETKAVGATVLRTHYPMHPYIHELADREGLLIWSEIPVLRAQDASTSSARACASWPPRSCARTSRRTSTTRR